MPRLGPKAFEQAAGFLRIRDGEQPLDASAVHPESYPIVDRMAKDLACSVNDLMRDAGRRQKIQLEKYVTEAVGLPTLTDILAELAKPGRDPRQQFEVFTFQAGVEKMEDLKPGMKLPGIVTNVTAFGAFVDIGVHQDGLVHVSQLCDRFIKDPAEVVKVQQKVMVTVTEVDLPRKRIALSMKAAPTIGAATTGKTHPLLAELGLPRRQLNRKLRIGSPKRLTGTGHPKGLEQSVQDFELGFEFSDALPQRLNGFFDFGGRVARRDVFRTVPIERDDLDEEQPFDQAMDFRFGELRDQFGMLARVLDAGVAEDLQAFATWVIHEEQRDAVVRGEIAGGKHLAVALVVGKRELCRTHDPQESSVPAPMLNVRPAALRNGGHVKGVARFDEGAFLLGERISLRCRTDAGVAPVIMLLRRQHGRREHVLHESLGHGPQFL